MCTEHEYEIFKEKYPKLYRYILEEPDETYDVEMLESMFLQRQRINNNSEESFVETNMKVAETIADRYLYNDDTLKKPNEKEMKKHREKVRKLYLNKKNKLDFLYLFQCHPIGNVIHLFFFYRTVFIVIKLIMKLP